MNRFLTTLNPWIDLLARVLIGLIFVVAGYGKIGGYEATQGYMTSMGVPGALLPLVIVTELGGGLLIMLGWFTRPVAIALAGFTLLSAILFHGNSQDTMQQIMLMKNLAIAGGFLFLVVHGAGKISLDQRFGQS